MRVQVKFYVPESVCFGHVYGGYVKSLIVEGEDFRDAWYKAFEAACKAGGDPNDTMIYKALD